MISSLKQFIHKRYNISFSKAGDDIQLYKLLKATSPGVYVDIGCWHPLKSSNTYYFYLRNWKGICIDPNPELKQLFQKFRKRDRFINCGISEHEETLDYYLLEERFSSMNSMDLQFLRDQKVDDKIKSTVQIPCHRLDQILDDLMVKTDRLDFFDIDVEGFDLKILRSNNWEKYRPKLIMIETQLSFQEELHSETVDYLREKDYRLIAKSVIDGDLGNLFLMNNRK